MLPLNRCWHVTAIALTVVESDLKLPPDGAAEVSLHAYENFGENLAIFVYLTSAKSGPSAALVRTLANIGRLFFISPNHDLWFWPLSGIPGSGYTLLRNLKIRSLVWVARTDERKLGSNFSLIAWIIQWLPIGFYQFLFILTCVIKCFFRCSADLELLLQWKDIFVVMSEAVVEPLARFQSRIQSKV